VARKVTDNRPGGCLNDRRFLRPAGGIVLRVIVGGDNDPIADDLGVKSKQRAADTGPAGAFTGMRFVEETVGPADQQPAVVVEELVWPPIERCSGRQIP
jgi:hypothetical protein